MTAHVPALEALGTETRILLLAAGVVFTWALLLGVQKYVQILGSAEGAAHIYTDIAHRAALLYSFALLLIAVFAELSDWAWQVDLIAGLVQVLFFVSAIGSYQVHGLRRDTDNQMRHPGGPLQVFMIALIIGEIGGFLVLLAGFVHAWAG
ncbi:MAG: hypothetical protein L0H31_12790 [Nocardioidaceae bacterium]|nr:hypothetical protein [Nocardioidaceae bacterium]